MFTPVPEELITRRPRVEDSQDLRLGFYVNAVQEPLNVLLEKLSEGDIVILGYADDRGVARNGGRSGAFAAPDLIRKYLYSMTPSHSSRVKPRIWDLGNLKTWSLELLEAQELARSVVSALRKKGVRVLSLGGGHDWAYSDFVDFGDDFPTHSARVINVDAHLDMRPEPEEQDKKGHSGTPFRRILQSGLKHPPKLSAVGMQEHCNSPAHVEWALSRQVSTLFLEEIPENLEKRWPLIEDRLQLKDPQGVYALSLDMDVFPQFIAPGVSAPQSIGLDPRLVIKMLQALRPQLKHVGIYEFNPRFDIDDRTARLAAKILHAFIAY